MTNLQERVQAALANDPRTREAAIEILNQNGVITLGGIVPQRETSEAAEAIAKGMDGVVSVVNEIQVRGKTDANNPYDVSGTLDQDVIVK
jgi:osmotically-inducible protein OsmY